MNVENEFESQESANPLATAWKKYFPFWPLFMVIIGFAVTCAWIFLKFQAPKYQATATLLLRDENKGLDDNKEIESLNPLGRKKISENEIEVIKSRELVGAVAKDLGLYGEINTKDRWRTYSGYGTAPFKVVAMQPDSILPAKNIPLQYNPLDSTVEMQGKKFPLNAWFQSEWGMIKFQSSPGKANDSTTSFVMSLKEPKVVTKDLIDAIDVSPASKLSSVVTLKYQDISERRVKDVLSGVVSAYENASKKERKDFIENTLAFLDARLAAVTKDLRGIESKLETYRATEGAIDVTSQGELFLQNVSANDQQLSDVNMKLAMLSQVEKYVNSKDSKGAIVPSTLGISDPLLTGLLEKLYDSELEYEKMKRTTAENNPLVTGLKDGIDKLRPAVLENIQSQKASLQASVANLKSTNNSYNSVLQKMPKQERDLVEINREQTVKSSIYNFLLQKKEETDLSRFSSVSDLKVVDKADVSPEPINTSKAIVYFLAAIVGFGISVVVVMLKESGNPNVLFGSDLEKLTPYPVICELPYERKFTPIVLHSTTNSVIGEQFRMLRNSLVQYIPVGSQSKRILVTSSVSGEGKSFISTNVALSLAMGGKRVVLVDYDLTNPTLHENLNIHVGRGVSEYLTGASDYKSIIHKTAAHSNLFFIGAGYAPGNSSDLIMSDKTQQLLELLDRDFDYVIIDSAPLGILADSYMLSRQSQATLYVVRHDHTPKKILARLEQNNKHNGIKNMFIVYNGIRRRGFTGSLYGQGYGQGYLTSSKYYKTGKADKLLN